MSFPPAALVAGRSLVGDLAAFAAAVEKPHEPESLAACGDALGSATPVRVEVTYPSGARAWLSTEQNDFGCRGIGNGLFVNHVEVGPQLLEAWEAGRWGPSPSPSPSVAVAPVSTADCPVEVPSLPRGPDAAFPVPAQPEGFDAYERLVPDEVPSAVLVCRYEPIPYGTAAERGQTSALVGGRSLGGDLAGLAGALDVPLGGEFGGCRLVASDPDPLRVLLRYPSGASVWLATETAANSCTGVGNGVARSATYFGDTFLSAWERGGLGVPASATPGAPVNPCAPPAGDRPGQEDVLVPDGWVSVSTCGPTGLLPVGDPAEVVRVLNAASSGPTGEVGRGDTFDECSARYPAALLAVDDVLVDYPAGPSVVVRAASACSPAWTNGTRGAQPTREQRAQLRDLLYP